MALTIKHSKVSTIPDGADTSLVRPSDWNADHTFTGTLEVAQGGTGATTAQGAANNILPAQAGQAGKVLGTDGTNTAWVAQSAGGGVTQIVAGSGISIDPPTGVGAVTINSTGSGSLFAQTQSVSPFETALGFEAGIANTGVNNTYLGYQAGKACTGATNNVVIGHQALDVATIPSSTVVIGASACGASSSMSQCVVIGHSAAGTTTALGADNTIIGFDAGRTVTGTSNILIGSACGNNATTVTGAVAVGNGCFGVLTSAAGSPVAVGNNALGSLTTGANNIAVGGLAGDSITTGANNTLVGSNSGTTLIVGTDNTFLGSQTGVLATGNQNTLIGSSSGTAITTGNANTFVGRNSGSIITTGLNNTIIGNYNGFAATMSNHVILADGAGTVRFASNNNGAVSFQSNFTYGNAGDVLRSGGTASNPTWANPNVQNVQTYTANTNLLPSVSVAFCNASGGSFTVTLPNAAGNAGLTLAVKRIDQTVGNTLTVASAGGTIEGLNNQVLGVSVGVTYISDGTNWYELANA